MPAIASPVIVSHTIDTPSDATRMTWGYYEEIDGCGGTCRMCGSSKLPHVPHACAKPSMDGPPIPVPVRAVSLATAARLRAFHEACVAGDADEIARLREALHAS